MTQFIPYQHFPRQKVGRSLFRHISPARRQRGTTLIESLVAALLSLVVGGALISLVQTTYTSRSTVMGEHAALKDSRRCMDILANGLRNAQMVTGQGAFSAATTNSITCYTTTTGTATTRYWLDTSSSPGSLKQTDSTGTTTILTDVQTLQFTYYTSSSANFTSTSAQWTTTANQNAPTATELPNLGAIAITATINSNGYSRAFTTFVRLRNSPDKPHL